MKAIVALRREEIADATDPLTVDGGATWDLYRECARRDGADADTYREILDARLEQATDRLAAYLDTRGATTVVVESVGTPDRTLAELARDGANADAWLKPRLREHVHGLGAQGNRVVDVFPGGTSRECHAREAAGERQGETFTCANPACGVEALDSDVNAAAIIATRARDGGRFWGRSMANSR